MAKETYNAAILDAIANAKGNAKVTPNNVVVYGETGRKSFGLLPVAYALEVPRQSNIEMGVAEKILDLKPQVSQMSTKYPSSYKRILSN